MVRIRSLDKFNKKEWSRGKPGFLGGGGGGGGGGHPCHKLSMSPSAPLPPQKFFLLKALK